MPFYYAVGATPLVVMGAARVRTSQSSLAMGSIVASALKHVYSELMVKTGDLDNK